MFFSFADKQKRKENNGYVIRKSNATKVFNIYRCFLPFIPVRARFDVTLKKKMKILNKTRRAILNSYSLELGILELPILANDCELDALLISPCYVRIHVKDEMKNFPKQTINVFLFDESNEARSASAN